jgi:hypothetical protein
MTSDFLPSDTCQPRVSESNPSFMALLPVVRRYIAEAHFSPKTCFILFLLPFWKDHFLNQMNKFSTKGLLFKKKKKVIATFISPLGANLGFLR